MFKTRRSIRKYKDIPIENDKLDMILQSTLCAPTSKNRRPWEFIVVQDKSTLNQVSKVREVGSAFLKDASCAILVLANTSLSEVWIEDTSIAGFAIQLAAQEQGLGSCWVQIRERNHNEIISASDYLKDLLNIPDNFEVACIIPRFYVQSTHITL
ncbi:nitroreductase family protein [Fusibacter tunisiensis]|uniref:Nitroreductase n=1 Tax=Fusibacter tunisiensis TaxID=1008308 RepID=A0ABS2MTR7_9FIRM|nr:nitroreductase family protein [Fusibacter tunisiensis]MBM7562841.1 nitroreductase [Fusibacter tunisiensis]